MKFVAASKLLPGGHHVIVKTEDGKYRIADVVPRAIQNFDTFEDAIFILSKEFEKAGLVKGIIQ